MDVRHTKPGEVPGEGGARPGAMEIILSKDDLSALAQRGETWGAGGLAGQTSYTQVWVDENISNPTAQVDGPLNVFVRVPTREVALPFEVGVEDIHPYGDAGPHEIEDNFGRTGKIIIQLARES